MLGSVPKIPKAGCRTGGAAAVYWTLLAGVAYVVSAAWELAQARWYKDTSAAGCLAAALADVAILALTYALTSDRRRVPDGHRSVDAPRIGICRGGRGPRARAGLVVLLAVHAQDRVRGSASYRAVDHGSPAPLLPGAAIAGAAPAPIAAGGRRSRVRRYGTGLAGLLPTRRPRGQRGRSTMNVAPSPRVLRSSIRPPLDSTRRLVIQSPRPCPGLPPVAARLNRSKTSA